MGAWLCMVIVFLTRLVVSNLVKNFNLSYAIRGRVGIELSVLSLYDYLPTWSLWISPWKLVASSSCLISVSISRRRNYRKESCASSASSSSKHRSSSETFPNKQIKWLLVTIPKITQKWINTSKITKKLSSRWQIGTQTNSQKANCQKGFDPWIHQRLLR